LIFVKKLLLLLNYFKLKSQSRN